MEWRLFCVLTLPFGWKASAYIYHNLGLAVTSAARSFGVPVSQYIDDRHVGQLCRAPASSTPSPGGVLAVAAAYILCYSHCIINYLIAEVFIMRSNSPVSAYAYYDVDALRA